MEVTCQKDNCDGIPHELLPPGFAGSSDWWTRAYSVAPDGRFLVIGNTDAERKSTPQIHVIVNWTEELQRLAPASHRQEVFQTASAPMWPQLPGIRRTERHFVPDPATIRKFQQEVQNAAHATGRVG